MFDAITCPECGYGAAVLERFRLASTEGPVEHLRTSCVNRHYFTVRADDADVAPATEHDSRTMHVGGRSATPR